MVVAVPQSQQIQDPPALEWQSATGLVPYGVAVGQMEARVAAIRHDDAPELVWLVEHPPLYTAGTSAKAGDLLDAERFPVHQTGRGGQYTYHGPGQRVAYVMIDLHRRGRDLRGYVHNLEQWVISTLACFDIAGERRRGRFGIWVDRGDGREDKIAAIGVRVRRWVTYQSFRRNRALWHRRCKPGRNQHCRPGRRRHNGRCGSGPARHLRRGLRLALRRRQLAEPDTFWRSF